MGDEESDRQARFRLLYEGHLDAVLAYTVSRTDRQRALEATEATFLVAWRRLDELPDQLRPWLFGIARRVLADERKATARYRALEEKLAAHTGEIDEDDVADRVAERCAVLDELRRLGARDREVLLLVAWEGLTLSEVAAAMGCSVTAAKVRMHRVRRRLAALQSTNGSGPPPVRIAPGITRMTSAASEEGTA